ncbi:hypothetical protein FACS189496_4090 [Bacilli bacterium]|nr:hypothetical protein FACS189496_4090 [Bacilli bacterium]
MYGVQFYKKVTGIVNISGVFSVSGSYNTHGIEFNDDVNGTINISGVFSFYNTDDVLGILFKNGEVSGNINIYGTFSVSNSILSPGHDYATGVKFNSTISSDAIFNSKCDMPTFFSNRQDNGN